jgi:hypothetical protein
MPLNFSPILRFFTKPKSDQPITTTFNFNGLFSWNMHRKSLQNIFQKFFKLKKRKKPKKNTFFHIQHSFENTSYLRKISIWVQRGVQCTVDMSKLKKYNTENSKQIFPEKELRGASPNSCVCERFIYIPTIGLPILLQENMLTDPGNI